MIVTYYSGTRLLRSNPALSFAVFVLFGSLLLNVIFSAYFVLIVRREPLSELGITTAH